MSPDLLEDISRAAERGEVFAYFGYGSLVNRGTHRTAIYGAVRASVRGWRRHWQGRPHHSENQLSLLSVKAEADPGHDLPGLLVFDRLENLEAVDEREGAYHRRDVARDAIAVATDIPSDVPIYIYEAKPEFAPGSGHAILQSYLDAVLQGYLREYGREAVLRFVAETHAFDSTPILRDRHAPRYTRNVTLTQEEIRLFDDALDAHGVTYRDPA